MHSIPSVRVVRVVEQLIELYGKPELALAHIQQEAAAGERLDIQIFCRWGLHAIGRKTEANAALASLVQKFGAVRFCGRARN